MIIDLTKEEYHGMNIGGVIATMMDTIDFSRLEAILIQCNNRYLHGTFLVPSALGFSTPLNTINPAKLILSELCVDPQDMEVFIDDYYRWKSTYNVKPTRSPGKITYTRDQQECTICTDTYELGDKLHEFICGHRIHFNCQSVCVGKCPLCRK